MILLLVDEVQELTKILIMEMEDKSNNVDIALDGHDGRNLGLKNQFDVIIPDLMLPGLNGHQICKELRNQHVGTPVFIISALDSQDEKEAGIFAGANDFLAKSFRFEDFCNGLVLLERDHRASSNGS